MSGGYDPLLQYFELGTELQPKQLETAQAFQALAKQIERALPQNAERTVALRKLLEGREAALRAALAILP